MIIIQVKGRCGASIVDYKEGIDQMPMSAPNEGVGMEKIEGPIKLLEF